MPSSHRRELESAGRLHLRASLVWASLGLLAACLTVPAAARAADLPSTPAPAGSVGVTGSIPAPGSRRADFAGETVSADARQVADWVMRSGDNRDLPFMIVDKADARMLIFAADGALLGAAPVLLGLATGDDSPPGIGDRPLALIAPAERITPAGRFEAALGRNLAGRDMLWVDYSAAVSVHRATDVTPGLSTNDRLARLASATTGDNRISHGCINVTDDFYERFIRPTFFGTIGIVYILPETRSVRDEFSIAA